MKIIVVTSGFWLWFLSRLNLDGYTTYWAIYVRPMETDRMNTVIKHERVHEAQMKHDGYVTFTIKYLYQFISGRIKYGNWFDAYKDVDYEIEARQIAKQEI